MNINFKLGDDDFTMVGANFYVNGKQTRDDLTDEEIQAMKEIAERLNNRD